MNFNIGYIIVILALCFIIVGTVLDIQENKKENKICKNKGYDYMSNTMRTSSGYIACCKTQYKDHIEIKEECKGVKK